MIEELREVYVDKNLEYAFCNGDGIFINANEEKLREFLTNSTNEHYAFERLNKPLLMIVKALCHRYGVEYDIQEQENGDIDLVVFKKDGNYTLPKMSVIEVIEFNLSEKILAARRQEQKKEEPSEKKKPTKVLSRKKDPNSIVQKKVKQQNPSGSAESTHAADQSNKNQVVKPVVKKPEIQQPPEVYIDTTPFEQNMGNAITFTKKHDVDFIREDVYLSPNPYYQSNFLPPNPYFQTQKPANTFQNIPYNSYSNYPQQDPTPQPQPEFQHKADPPKQKFNYKQEDFPSL